MKTFVRVAVFLSLFSPAALAQDNPYMPGGNSGPSGPMTPEQRQELIQNILSGRGTGVGEYVPGQDQPSPPPSVPAAPVAPPAPSVSETQFQELRSQQADDIDAITREKADREVEIKAIKDAFDQQIRDMQKKIDAMQGQIDDLRYKSHY